MGCESLQKKFTRKPKTPAARPAPVVAFRDYTQGVTPLDRYQKHFAMFAYWNDQLLTELQEQRDRNPKRLERASREALQELELIQGLLQEGPASRLQPLLEERRALNQQLHHGPMVDSQRATLMRTLEAQARRLNRGFSWRSVQDQLKASDDARSN